MSSSDLRGKLEAAIVQYINDKTSTGLNVCRGQESAAKNLPAITVEMVDDLGDPYFPAQNVGNSMVRVNVTIASQRDDVSISTHQSNKKTVFDLFRSDTFVADFNSTQTSSYDIWMLAAWVGGELMFTEQRCYKDGLELNLYMSNSKLA